MKISYINGKQAKDYGPKNYEGFGDLILSYLNVKRSESDETLAGIIEVNDCEELWNAKELNFVEDFATSNATIKDFSIGYLGFGTFKVKGITFKCVIEQNASPLIVYTNMRNINVLKSILGNENCIQIDL